MNTSTEPIPEKNIDLESPTHKYVLQSPQGPDKERMFHNSPQITLIYTDYLFQSHYTVYLDILQNHLFNR